MRPAGSRAGGRPQDREGPRSTAPAGVRGARTTARAAQAAPNPRRRARRGREGGPGRGSGSAATAAVRCSRRPAPPARGRAQLRRGPIPAQVRPVPAGKGKPRQAGPATAGGRRRPAPAQAVTGGPSRSCAGRRWGRNPFSPRAVGDQHESRCVGGAGTTRAPTPWRSSISPAWAWGVEACAGRVRSGRARGAALTVNACGQMPMPAPRPGWRPGLRPRGASRDGRATPG